MKTSQKLQKIADNFNQRYPVGSSVYTRTDCGLPPRIDTTYFAYETSSEAQVDGERAIYVQVDGKRLHDLSTVWVERDGMHVPVLADFIKSDSTLNPVPSWTQVLQNAGSNQ